MDKMAKKIPQCINVNIVAFSLLAMLIGCNSSNNSSSTAEPVDSLGPVLESIEPQDGTIEIGLNTQFIIVFNEPISATSINSDSVFLQDDSNNIIDADLALNTDQISLSLQSVQPLLSGANYTLTLTQSITDLAGNQLTSSQNFSYKTIDNEVPVITAMNPEKDEQLVDPNTRITVTFDEALNPETVNASSIILIDDSGSEEQGEVNLSAAGNEISFVLNESLSLFAEHQITISQSISDVAGNTLADKISWNFKTNDGQWSTPQLVEISNAGNAINPQVAMDNQGNAVAVWSQMGNVNKNIWSSFFNNETGWTDPIRVEFNEIGDADFPQVAIDHQGNVVVVWHQLDESGSRFDIWSNRYQSDKGWGESELIEFNDQNIATNPNLVIDPQGSVMAIWRQSFGANFVLVANRYTQNTGWGVPEVISGVATGNASHHRSVVDNLGNVTTVWQQSDVTQNDIWANHFNPETGWKVAQLIENNNIGHALTPEITIDEQGDANAIWRQWSGFFYLIYSAQFSQESGWSDPVLVSQNGSSNASDPSIASSGKGRLHAIWQQSEDSVTNLYQSEFIPQTGWTTPELLEFSDTNPTLGAKLVADFNGNAMAIWNQRENAVFSLWASRYSIETGWQSPTLLENSDIGDALESDIAINAQGNIQAVWQQKLESFRSIYTSRFN